MKELTQDELKCKVSYDPDTGIMKKLVMVRPGKRSGWVVDCRGTSYRKMSINGVTYSAHRLAFLYMTGSFPIFDVDHIDGDGLNNRWTNLRDVTKQINTRNSKLRSDSSGYCGIYWDKSRCKWKSHIFIDGKIVSLGRFDCKIDAIEARMIANKRYGFNVHGIRL